MSASDLPRNASGAPERYEIRVRGHLADRWAGAFEGLALRREEGGVTLLSGTLTDQAALHALLRRIRDLGVPLLSVTREPSDAEPPPGDLTP